MATCLPRRSLPLVAIIVCMVPQLGFPQQPCQPPPLPLTSREQNIFNEQQEADLGDAIAEHVQHHFRLTDDPEMTAFLSAIANRLLKYLPVKNLRLRAYLVDLPIPNAFASAGGRVYVSRKLVAFVRNEDELAGILAHELGHMAGHHTAILMTRTFREVLGVREVGDRKDILEKYHRMIANWRRKPKAFRHRPRDYHEDQMDADQAGLWAAASAGYSPQSTVDVFDRLAETEGKAGSWLSDLFGTTKPESRRLREMQRTLAKLPPGCVEQPASARAEEFRAWQTKVIEYAGWRRQELLHDVVSRVRLDPPLPLSLRQVRFSPDGKLLLAQDAAGIYVLTREPLGTRFQIEAVDAFPAQFSPDSRFVVFYDSSYRVEIWDVEGKKRVSAYEPVFRAGCFQSALSPDGKTLACYTSEFDLTLKDVPTGTEIVKREKFVPSVNPWFYWHFALSLFPAILKGKIFPMSFSPDARFFVAGFGEKTLAVDLNTRRAVPLPGAIKNVLIREFIFLDSDRLLGMNTFDPQKSPILSFPAGKVLERVQLVGNQSLSAPGHGDFTLVRPFKDKPVGVLELKTQKIRYTGERTALDIYDNVVTGEALDGQLCLAKDELKETNCVKLPVSQLGGLAVLRISADLKWVAISGPDHGGLWDLASGKRMYNLRGFDGCYFTPNGFAYLDLPKDEDEERAVVWYDMTRHLANPAYKVTHSHAQQHGQFLVVIRTGEGSGAYAMFDRNVTREFRDIGTGKLLWFRHFPKEAPWIYVHSDAATVVLSWEVTSDAAQDEIRANPDWRNRFSGRREKGDYFLEVLDATSGKPLGALVLPTGKGSIHIRSVFAAGDWVLVSDSENRVLVFSLSTGEEKGRLFGSLPEASVQAGLLAVSNERDRLAIYDLETLEQVDEFTFANPITSKQFSAEGKRLLVLTADQTAYLLDLASQDSSLAVTAGEK